MDFNSINEASSVSNFPPAVKLNSLELDEVFKITKIKKVQTKKLGEKIVINISERRSIFLPEAINDYLMENDREYSELEKLIIKKVVTFQPLGASGMEFSIKDDCKSEYMRKFKSYNIK